MSSVDIETLHNDLTDISNALREMLQYQKAKDDVLALISKFERDYQNYIDSVYKDLGNHLKNQLEMFQSHIEQIIVPNTIHNWYYQQEWENFKSQLTNEAKNEIIRIKIELKDEIKEEIEDKLIKMISKMLEEKKEEVKGNE